ncbi:MAG: 30S ribosomal protein S20 [Gemmatimonadetes bacterium]|nr:30S ribosomal protein S20 [Gemmatimonadota bacterium]
MPRIRSAKKQMRQSRKHRVVNRNQRSALRTAIKEVRSAGSAADAQKAYQTMEQLLDRAARKGLIHKNSAARHKSRLWKVVSGMK